MQVLRSRSCLLAGSALLTQNSRQTEICLRNPIRGDADARSRCWSHDLGVSNRCTGPSAKLFDWHTMSPYHYASCMCRKLSQGRLLPRKPVSDTPYTAANRHSHTHPAPWMSRIALERSSTSRDILHSLPSSPPIGIKPQLSSNVSNGSVLAICSTYKATSRNYKLN